VIYWAPLLHFYQPPTQVSSVLRRICDESYRPLVRMFREHPNARATVNINGSLTELLAEQGGEDVIAGLRELAERCQIEFVATGMYHPILPLIPRDEMRRQIALNFQTNRAHFGEIFAPQGFFPPELCYGPDIVETILETGHRWTILSGIACPVEWPLDVLHHVNGSIGKLRVVFRDDVLSNAVSFRHVDPEGFLARLRALNWGRPDNGRPDIYVATAMDAETFGHHIPGWDQRFLARIYELLDGGAPLGPIDRAAGASDAPAIRPDVGPLALAPMAATRSGGPCVGVWSSESDPAAPRAGVRAVTLGQLVSLFPTGGPVNPRPSSWSTTAADISSGVPYPLWRQPGNALHDLQWELLGICVELVRTALAVSDEEPSRKHALVARSLLDRALHSCQFWWASKRPMWDINMVHRGTLEAQQVVLNADKAIGASGAPATEKTRAYHAVIVARDLVAKIEDRLLAG
jgi:hypothetical protein